MEVFAVCCFGLRNNAGGDEVTNNGLNLVLNMTTSNFGALELGLPSGLSSLVEYPQQRESEYCMAAHPSVRPPSRKIRS